MFRYYFLISILFLSLSAANADPGFSAEILIKNISKAGDSCSRLPLTNQENNTAYKPQADLSCIIYPADVLEKPENFIFIDVRNPLDFNKQSIPNSINITVGELARKDHLKNKRVIIIGYIKNTNSLFESCAFLKRNGFKSVNVLRGGINAWLSAGGELTQSPSASLEISDLTSEELLVELYSKNNIFIIDKKQEKFIQYAYASTLQEDVDTFLKKNIARLNKVKLASVIVITNSEKFHALKIKYNNAIELLGYTHGLEEFERYLNVQKKIWSSYKNGPRLPTCGL